ncbi:phage major capsid protein [Sulfitobacter sp. 1A12126]|uniref:phage major capsid protein n=1 Tax=Sulfitobacter sp. 1A12126 TaxID=3368591 RepID=UPI003745D2E7
MKHDKHITPAGKAIEHLRTKSGDQDPIDMLAQKLGDMMDATNSRLEGIEKDTKGLSNTLDTVEKKMLRGGGSDPAPQSWGQQFIATKGEDLSDLSQRNSGSVQMNVKALTTGATSGGAIDVPMRDQTNMLPQTRLPVRALLNVIATDSGTVEYASQTTRTNNAATVAEGAAKPESTYEWELKNIPTRVIAHFTKASNQIMSDAPQVQGMIDSELRYGLTLVEEQQLLFGNNTGSNLDGLTPNATAYDATTLAGYTPATNIDTIGVGILQCTLADYMPTGMVLHPSDWWAMRLLKDNDNKYLLGDPQTVVAPSLFGLPVVVTKSMTAGSFLVGDFMSAGTLFDRWQPRVEVGFENDDFTKNLITIRAENRLALAVKNGDALVYGTF